MYRTFIKLSKHLSREKTLKAGNYHEGKRLSYQYNLKNNIDKITPPAKCGGVIVVTAD